MIKAIAWIVSCGLLVNLAACGTILHPERKGQTSGQLDPSIVVLNGIGLLMFFIPGIIAFAVDFTNGTIYLPEGRQAQLSPDELDRIQQSGQVDTAALEVIVKGMLAGHPYAFYEGELQVKYLESMADAERQINSLASIKFAHL